MLRQNETAVFELDIPDYVHEHRHVSSDIYRAVFVNARRQLIMGNKCLDMGCMGL